MHASPSESYSNWVERQKKKKKACSRVQYVEQK